MTSANRSPPVRDGKNTPRGWWLALATIWGAAIAQPLYEVLKPSPEFFIEHGVVGGNLLLFALLLSIGCPAALAGIVLGIRLSSGRRAGLAAFLSVVSLLGTALGSQLISSLEWLGPLPVLALALVGGLGLSSLCYRSDRLVAGLAWLAIPSLIILPLLFLLAPSIRGLWRQGPVAVGSFGGGRVPVVLIVFDELPLASLVTVDDAIDGNRFPNFADLAASSSWFRNATTPEASTKAAIPALLTGHSALPDTAPVAAEYPQNLFTAIAGSHELRVLERVTALCPKSQCPPVLADPPVLPSLSRDLMAVYAHLVMPLAWRDRLPLIDQGWRDFGGSRDSSGSAGSAESEGTLAIGVHDFPARIVAQFSRGLGPSARPTLHYLHLMLPHVPWRYLPSGKSYDLAVTASSRSMRRREDEDEWAVVQSYQRHLLQTEFADKLLGEILSALRTNRLWDSSLLIVTSDHGVSFVRGQPGRGGTDALNIPLFFKLPRQAAPTVRDDSVSLLDVLPTILEVLELQVDWNMTGRSVLSSPHDALDHRPSASETRAARLRAARAKSRWFLHLGEREGTFRIGPHQNLRGRAVERYSVALTAHDQLLPTVSLEHPGLLDDVDPAGSFLPARIAGRVDFGPLPPRRLGLAIAVNGAIAATTHSFGPNNGRFSAVVPPSIFERGRNEVEIHLIHGGSPPTLSPLRTTAAGYQLLSVGQDTVLVTPESERIVVERAPEHTLPAHDFPRFYSVRGPRSTVGTESQSLVLVFYRSAFIGALKERKLANGDPAPRPALRVARTVAPDRARLRVILVRETTAVEVVLRWR